MKKRNYPEPKLWYPQNPKKYSGDVNNIWYRSSWEKRLFEWLDKNENVIEWNSEEVIIPYISPIDGKWHRYFIDCFAKIKNNEEKIKSYLIEVKPFVQTQAPVIKKKITKTYITEVTNWGINSAKWESAKKYCKQRDWKFLILTEKDMFK